MRELRFVGPGGDGEHVVVQTLEGDEQFRLLVDGQLRDAAGARPTVAAAAPEVTLSPREIQTRVRSGADPAEVAAEVGVPVERILTFATPVLEERSRITGEARRARARRGTTEGQLVQFGEAVDGRYTAHGIDPAAVSWDSYRRDDGIWVISATWRGGDSERTAQWAFALAARTVTPLDETAADLLSDRPIRPVVRAVPDPAPETPEPAPGKPEPAVETAVENERRDAESNTAPLPTVRAEQAEQPAEVAEPRDTPLPLRLAEPVRKATPRPAETEDQRAARARIPSWDDIMLGVRRKRD